jgi:hypothetical protein
VPPVASSQLNHSGAVENEDGPARSGQANWILLTGSTCPLISQSTGELRIRPGSLLPRGRRAFRAAAGRAIRFNRRDGNTLAMLEILSYTPATGTQRRLDHVGEGAQPPPSRLASLQNLFNAHRQRCYAEAFSIAQKINMQDDMADCSPRILRFRHGPSKAERYSPNPRIY